MAVTICIGQDEGAIPTKDAVALADQLRLYGRGFRGEIGDPTAALALAHTIDSRIADHSSRPIEIDDLAELDALHTVLNAIVHELGPAMKLYGAVAAERQQRE